MHEQSPALKLNQYPLPGRRVKKYGNRCGFSEYAAVAVLFCLFFSACAKKTSDRQEAQFAGPPVGFESPEFFVGNLAPQNQNLKSWRDMAPTLRKSLLHVKSKAGDAVALQRPGVTLTYGELLRTLTLLEELLPRLDAEPRLFLQNFRWIELNGGINFSGYYEPTLRASRTRAPGYTQAIYRCPSELKKPRRRGGDFYSRRTIEEKQVLAGKGLELAWVADPVDSFFLEIQGSGRLVFDDGSWMYVNYDCQNGHKYKSSGKIMREKGLLSRGDIFEQREWFRKNPHRVREVLNENPSYVFFRSGGNGPIGAMGYAVDAWLSLATSKNYIPLGAVVAYGVNVPDQRFGRLPLRGIGFAQDVGGAIKGNRIDVFCGSDDKAEYIASHLDAKGPAWILTAR